MNINIWKHNKEWSFNRIVANGRLHIFRSVPKKILQLWRFGSNEYEQDMCSKGIQLSKFIQIYWTRFMKQLLRRTCRSLYCTILYLINLFHHICVQFHPNPLRTGLSPWTTEDPYISHVFPWCLPPWWRLLEAGPGDRGFGLLKDSQKAT